MSLTATRESLSPPLLEAVGTHVLRKAGPVSCAFVCLCYFFFTKASQMLLSCLALWQKLVCLQGTERQFICSLSSKEICDSGVSHSRPGWEMERQEELIYRMG